MLNKSPVSMERIKRYGKEQEAAILADLQKLISFQTIPGALREIEACLDWFLHRAEEMGFRVFKTTTNDVGVVEAGQGEETLGILVHLDVVNIGDSGKWRYPPFEGTIADGCIWGRGAMDDKGAAMICLYAMKALLEFGIPFHKRIRLIVGTCEESEWTDMENFKREYPCPDYGFSPDGDFPVYNIENGYADLLLKFDESEQISQCDCFEVDSGRDANTIPSRAVLKVDDRQYECEGVSAHSAAPELGINAIVKLCVSCRWNQGIGSGYDFNFSRFISEILAGDCHGGKLKIEGEEERWEGQELAKTTVAPTVLKRNGDKVLLNINIRQNANVKRADIEKVFDEYRKTYHYEYEIVEYLDPMKVSRNLPPFSIMAETYEDWGRTSRFLAAGGTSYAKSMKNFVSWGPCFPEELSCAHQENERIAIDSLFRAMGIYADYMCRIVTIQDQLLKKGQTE
ncbi:MAG: M20/M25/M40 family metallo-hydrolase [Eubacteriales bacterium]|nr:M20/M25/M40 family metallo-hydrolase [Eubacteriales bacterium]